MTINRRNLALSVTIWWGLFWAIRYMFPAAQTLVNILGFSFVVLVPGVTVMALINLKHIRFWGRLSMTIGLSVLGLMVIGLIGNSLLPAFGVIRPLDTLPVALEITLLTFIPGTLLYVRMGRKSYRLPRFAKFYPTRTDILFVAASIGLVVLSVLGAISLNNNGSNILTFLMLISMAILAGRLLYCSARVGENTIPTVLFFMALSLLLMTSLRGWFTSGHDVQHEYRVFELTKASGIWRIGKLHDAYNACMSITILPTMLSNVLKTGNPYIFKIFFQIIFALTPSLVYLTVRRWCSAAIAFASALYFVAFPTFFGDMPMLNRQEIAFLFLALMIYVVLNKKTRLRVRRVLFVAFGFGLVLSHYSTTYSVIAIMLLATVMRPIIIWLAAWVRKPHVGWPKIPVVLRRKARQKPSISLGIVLMLLIGSTIWTSSITHTSGAATAVIKSTLQALKSDSDSGRSSDLNYSVLSSKKLSAQAELGDYVHKVVIPLRKKNGADLFIDSNPRTLKAIDDAVLPLTPLGKKLSQTGVNVASFNFNFRQTSAKILQVLILIGLLYVLLKTVWSTPIDIEFVMLAVASLIFVLAQVVLPILSSEYGLLRAFQQSLMFLGLFVVLGSIVLIKKLPTRFLRKALPMLLAIVFFASSTGIFTQALGGYFPQLHLNNGGKYYDIYYLHAAELAGIDWLGGQIQHKPSKSITIIQTSLQSDLYSFPQLSPDTKIDVTNDVYPALIRNDSYVFLGYTNVIKHEASVSHNGDVIKYHYSNQQLSGSKDLIYSNGGTEIYK
jgi:uncharacterized membrane protein